MTSSAFRIQSSVIQRGLSLLLRTCGLSRVRLFVLGDIGHALGCMAGPCTNRLLQPTHSSKGPVSSESSTCQFCLSSNQPDSNSTRTRPPNHQCMPAAEDQGRMSNAGFTLFRAPWRLRGAADETSGEDHACCIAAGSSGLWALQKDGRLKGTPEMGVKGSPAPTVCETGSCKSRPLIPG